MRRREAVFLIGFMGVGKTTIGRALAGVLGWDFLDLDERLVESEGRGIAAIFRESGEPFFRALETRLLAGLRGRGRLVVACGGGTYAHGPARAVIDEIGTAVWIRLPLAQALARCGAAADRPLLGTPAEAEALYRGRLASYRAAPLCLDVEGLDPVAAARRLAGLL